MGTTGTNNVVKLPQCIDITLIFDKNGMSPLHFAASQNSFNAVQLLCEHVLQYGNGACFLDDPRYCYQLNQDMLANWINSQSKSIDSFTPIHFAAFFGNFYLIKYFISQGGNPFVTNQSDINMLHVAAQGDKPQAIAYFLKFGLDINSKDKRNSTPLHWAAFAGADIALNYILSWGGEINAQDIKGLTPLHLAVRTSEDILTTRSIRALLLKGARLDIKDNDGLTPIDYLQDFQDNSNLI